jgi:hypothetical protein
LLLQSENVYGRKIACESIGTNFPRWTFPFQQGADVESAYRELDLSKNPGLSLSSGAASSSEDEEEEARYCASASELAYEFPFLAASSVCSFSISIEHNLIRQRNLAAITDMSPRQDRRLKLAPMCSIETQQPYSIPRLKCHPIVSGLRWHSCEPFHDLPSFLNNAL